MKAKDREFSPKDDTRKRMEDLARLPGHPTKADMVEFSRENIRDAHLYIKDPVRRAEAIAAYRRTIRILEGDE